VGLRHSKDRRFVRFDAVREQVSVYLMLRQNAELVDDSADKLYSNIKQTVFSANCFLIEFHLATISDRDLMIDNCILNMTVIINFVSKLFLNTFTN